ncbi:MAG: ribosome small subunit-dependent GTPase A [Treponema sp.]|jgi:ribosome biogenesis GTPase|nr:ribosome small subunit-dependent GTPase A [Treponema sp.]
MNPERTLSGLVLRGSRNIFTVRAESGELECRIKGKILKGAENAYNPLAPGDIVRVEPDSGHPGKGMITALEERKNFFSRFNQKGNSTQLLAANVDLVLCMTTRVSPPFRPRFLDRVLLQTDIAGIPALVICNKADLESDDPDIDERLEDFRRIGYEVTEISIKTGQGIEGLRRRIAGKCSVLTGQSGVGKSSLINGLLPELNIKTGIINEKYDRGNHTTVLASMVEINAYTRIIDTPGVRRFVPDGIAAEDLVCNMREFAPLAGKCSFGLSCSHQTEPGCKIMEAVAAGVIHEDRYISFLRIHDELAGNNNVD